MLAPCNLTATIVITFGVLVAGAAVAAEPTANTAEVHVLESVEGKFGTWEVLELDGLRIHDVWDRTP